MDMNIGANQKNILNMKPTVENRVKNESNENSKFIQIYNQIVNKSKVASQNQKNESVEDTSKLQPDMKKITKSEETSVDKLKVTDENLEETLVNTDEDEKTEDLFIALEQLVKILDTLVETKINTSENQTVKEVDSSDKPLKETEVMIVLDELKELVKYKESVDLSDADVKSEFGEKIEGVLNKLQKLNSVDLLKNEEVKTLVAKIETGSKNLGFVEVVNNENLKLTHQIYQRMKSAVILKSEEVQMDSNNKANNNANVSAADKSSLESKIVMDVKSELSDLDNSDLEQNESNGIEKTDIKLAGSVSTDSKTGVTFIDKLQNVEIVKTTDTQQIIEQINKSLRSIKLLNGTQEIKIMLKPENLGEVNLKMTLDKGLLTAKLVVESSLVKDAIDKQLGTLKETLQNQGYEVKELKIVVKTPEGEILNFDDNNKGSENHKRQQKNSEKNTDDSFEEYFETQQFEISI